MRSARSACGPSCATPARASGGTSSSPATTTSATRPWSAPRCATPSTTATARPLAMLGFSTAARKLAPRDSFIGWTPQLREKNLPLVIDNPRFLILPWITIPNLGSHILSLVRRQLPDDWTERYNTTPVLIETFVRDPALHRRLVQGIRLDPRRNHQGTGPLRPTHQTGPAQERDLAPATPKGLAAHSQPVRSWSSVSPCGPSSRRDRTKTARQ